MEGKYRTKIRYTGRVQGVGFRYKVSQIAKGYEVTGTVENLDDGAVLLVACGDKAEVRAFTEEVARVMTDFIRDADSREDYTQDTYKEFNIIL